MERNNKKSNRGFSLTEVVITASIAGALSTLAVPNYISQLQRSKQADAAALVAQIMNQATAYNDEFGTPAQSWFELDKIATIMTTQGAATEGDLEWITLQGNKYRIKGTIDSNDYTFRAEPGEIPPAGEDPENAYNTYNLFACINVATGASEIKKGDGTTPATADDLNCT